MSGTTTDEASKREAPLREGVVIAGKYRLIGELGAGAMGTVWSATHQTLGHQVAIKFLLGSITSSEEGRARFEREAKLAARLGEASRHITRVIDHGVTDERVPYLVMELLRGEALSSMLKREKRISLPFAARIVQQLARALYVAHSAGVIHRDLKPANIFLCTPEQGEEVEVKLLDFGVAKATMEHEDEHTTVQGQLIGTPGYMSPEQVTCDKSIDARSDLWAVAAIVYRMVVGRSPFGGGAMQEIGLRILSTDPLPPSSIWPDLPVELDIWIQRGLAKKPDLRFQSARELSDFLATVAGISSSPTSGYIKLAVQRKILAGTADDSAQTLAVRPVNRRPPPLWRKYRRLGVAGAVTGAALLVMLIAWAGGDPKAPSAPQPSAVASASTPLPALSIAPAPTTIASALPATPALSPSTVASASQQPTPAPAPSASLPAKTKSKQPDGSGWNNKHEL